MRTLRVAALVWLLCVPGLAVAESTSTPLWRVFPEGQRPDDGRLGPLRTLRDSYHPWSPPKTRDEWQREAQAIRQRLLVAMGLWPMPPKRPLRPLIHGRIDRGDYTIEKVYFASRPGVYVTGNLYRPKNVHGKVPGVLCPHGHWKNGRFYEATDREVKKRLETGAEQFECGARYPLQARMVQLARMGCVVFHYDMIGYADNKPLEHRAGFNDVRAGLHLHNPLGVQTFNSIRALDFLLSLPEVDPHRIGVTGASGGGTQTFMLCAVDPRPAVAFPAVMVSTNMQGGCVCENADYLRIGINNIAIAALFAPKPLGMTGAHDWTIDIETKGLPELKAVYSLFGQPDHVMARCFPQFGHNYNQVSRQVMYEWFNRHLHLGWKSPVREKPFEPVPPAELSVFDQKHPLPDDALTADKLRERLEWLDAKWFQSILPRSKEQLAEYRRWVEPAARVMLDPLPEDAAVEAETRAELTVAGGASLQKGTLHPAGGREQIPWVLLKPKKWNGRVVAWFDQRGKQALFDKKGPTAEIKRLLQAGVAVASADVFQTGEYLLDPQQRPVPRIVDWRYSGYTFGYNRPWVSKRVRDVLTLVRWLQKNQDVRQIDLVGTGAAGRWVLLARPFAGKKIGRTIADVHGFGFTQVHSFDDPEYLPGALKYGGLGGLAALAAPAPLLLTGTRGVPGQELEPLIRVYMVTAERPMEGTEDVMEASHAGERLELHEEALPPAGIVDRLLR